MNTSSTSSSTKSARLSELLEQVIESNNSALQDLSLRYLQAAIHHAQWPADSNIRKFLDNNFSEFTEPAVDPATQFFVPFSERIDLLQSNTSSVSK